VPFLGSRRETWLHLYIFGRRQTFLSVHILWLTKTLRKSPLPRRVRRRWCQEEEEEQEERKADAVNEEDSERNCAALAEKTSSAVLRSCGRLTLSLHATVLQEEEEGGGRREEGGGRGKEGWTGREGKREQHTHTHTHTHTRTESHHLRRHQPCVPAAAPAPPHASQ